MANQLRNLKQPCMKYESSFKHDEVEKITLIQTYVDSTKKKKCPVFSGEHGIESLLYVEDRFSSISRQLEYTTGAELFNNFEELMVNNAEERWENIVAPIAEPQRTPIRFELAVDELRAHYCDHEARDTMFDYLRTVQKPYQVEPQQHADRMQTLIRYSNKLPGTEPELNEQQSKTLIFKSFPFKWQQAYIRSGRNLRNDTLMALIQYMKDEKGFSDAAESRKRKMDQRNNGSNGQGGGRNHNRSGSGNYQGRGRGRGRGGQNNHGNNHNGNNNGQGRRSNPCRRPGHHGHDWGDCFDNPNSRNFKPNRMQPGTGPRPWQNAQRYRQNQNNNQNNNNNSQKPNENYHNANDENRLVLRSGSAGSTISSAREAPQSGWQIESHHIDVLNTQDGGSAGSTGGSHGFRRGPP